MNKKSVFIILILLFVLLHGAHSQSKKKANNAFSVNIGFKMLSTDYSTRYRETSLNTFHASVDLRYHFLKFFFLHAMFIVPSPSSTVTTSSIYSTYLQLHTIPTTMTWSLGGVFGGGYMMRFSRVYLNWGAGIGVWWNSLSLSDISDFSESQGGIAIGLSGSVQAVFTLNKFFGINAGLHLAIANNVTGHSLLIFRFSTYLGVDLGITITY